MIKKEIFSYTEEEKKKLLLQWWYSDTEKKELVKELEKFDKLDVIGDSKPVLEMTEFMKICDFILDIVLKTAVIAYAFADGSEKAHEAMKKEEFYKHCNKSAKLFDWWQNSAIVKIATNEFLDDTINKYNDDLTNGEALVDKILTLSKPYTEFKCYALTGPNILNIYNRCLVETKDIETGKFNGSVLVGEGLKGCSLFSTDRINYSRDEIEHMIKSLPEQIKDGISYDEFCKTKSGYKWGNDFYADMLMKLGTAAMLLYFPLPREDWEYLPGGKPYIIASETKERIILGDTTDEYISETFNAKKR